MTSRIVKLSAMKMRHASMPATIVTLVVIAAAVVGTLMNVSDGAMAALVLLPYAALLVVFIVPRIHPDLPTVLRMTAGAVLTGGSVVAVLAVTDDPSLASIVTVGLLAPVIVALLLSAPQLRPTVFLAIGAAAIVGLWLALAFFGLSRPDEAGRTFVVEGLWFWLALSLPFMAFPGLVIAVSWVGLEWWSAHRATA